MKFKIIALNIIKSRTTGVRYLIYASMNRDGSYSSQYKGKDGLYRSNMVSVSDEIANLISFGGHYVIQIKNGELLYIE